MNNANAVVPMNKKFSPWIAEEELLSALVQNRQKLTTFIDEIDPEFFNSNDCKSVFKMTKLYFEKYNSPPKKQVLLSSVQKLLATATKGVSHTVINTVERIFEREQMTDNELQYYHDELLKFIKTGKIRDVIFEGINKIDDPNSFEDIQEKLKNAVLWRVDEALGTDITNVKDRYAKQKELLESYVPSPWSKLNAVIGGGFFNKTLSCFVAGTSVGKSIALDQVAFYAWSVLHKNVLVVSLELSEEIKSMRIDSMFLDKFLGELPSKQKEVEEAYSKIDTNGKRLIIKEFPTSSVSVRKVGNFISKLSTYSDFKPEFIVVDYGDLLLPNSGKRESLYSDGGAVFEALRGLSYEFNCPVVTATQFNRCISVDCTVQLESGESVKVTQLTVGSKILGSDGYVEVKHVYPIEKKKGYKVTTKSGKVIVCSSEHKFPTKDGEKSISSGLSVGTLLYTQQQNTTVEDYVLLVEEVGNVDMLDIEVSGDHLFFANGVLTHNSSGEKTPSEVNEYDISESHKKIMTLDTCVAIVATPGMRAQGQACFKTLKARMGVKDTVIPMGVSYEYFKFIE